MAKVWLPLFVCVCPTEFRRVSMGHLLHWSGQQQHLLQCLQALGAQEMQWAQALEKKTLTTDVHSARELHAPWMADHRRSRSDLTSEVVASFCYLGDMLSAAGGCELSTTTRVKTAWKKFKDLLPVLSSHHLSFKTYGRVYSSCVRSAILHASET